MLIRKKPPRAHALGEPLLHENHPRPLTRRQMLGAGLISGSAMVIGPAWLGALLRAGRANAALSPDIQALLTATQCNVPSAGGGGGGSHAHDAALDGAVGVPQQPE